MPTFHFFRKTATVSKTIRAATSSKSIAKRSKASFRTTGGMVCLVLAPLLLLLLSFDRGIFSSVSSSSASGQVLFILMTPVATSAASASSSQATTAAETQRVFGEKNSILSNIHREQNTFPNISYSASTDYNTGKIQQTAVSVKEKDLIYQRSKRLSPVIVEKYRLVFFHVPKVASTAFMILLQKMSGVDRSALEHPHRVHHPTFSKLRYLYHFNISRATQIMNDPGWIRATFVRNPHERLLSAYLDKGIGTRFDWIRDSCCRRWRDCIGPDREDQTFEKFVDFVLNDTCRNDHWYPQTERIDAKFWPSINFVGHMETLQDDTRLMLVRAGAWADYGATGWGSKGADPVFARSTREGRGHARDTASQMPAYYNQSLPSSSQGTLYDRVAHYYEVDYSHSMLGLSSNKLGH